MILLGFVFLLFLGIAVVCVYSLWKLRRTNENGTIMDEKVNSHKYCSECKALGGLPSEISISGEGVALWPKDVTRDLLSILDLGMHGVWDDGDLEATERFCFPCLAKFANICVGCLEDVKHLFADSRCTSGPYVCYDCLSSPTKVHLHQCEANGCMTIEEFSKNAQQLIEGGEL